MLFHHCFFVCVNVNAHVYIGMGYFYGAFMSHLLNVCHQVSIIWWKI